MKNKNTGISNRQSKKILLLIGLLVAVILAVIAVMYYQKRQSENEAVIRPVNTVDYSGPTQEEIDQTETFKKQQQEKAAQTPSNAATVTPVISYLGQYDASIEGSAVIGSITEDGGLCTLTLINGTSKVVKTSAAVKDAQSTRCELFMFPATELRPTGTWTGTVSYKSDNASGVSEKVSFEVN